MKPRHVRHGLARWWWPLALLAFPAALAIVVAPVSAQTLSSDATLRNLTLSEGRLSPAFDSATTTYLAAVGYTIPRITVSPVTNDASATVAYTDGADQPLTDVDSAARQQVDLAVGENVTKVKVTAEDGNATETYTITVTRTEEDTSLSPTASDATAAFPSSAVYHVTFTGAWDTTVTPDGLPGRAHFSPLVGAVHSARVAFLESGEMASAGIESMAQVGATSALEGEVDTAINAHPPTALSVLSRSRDIGTMGTATLSNVALTTDHPRVTLTAMIAPSHDWFVGVSGDTLELRFNEPLDLGAGRLPLVSAFTVTADGVPIAVGAVRVVSGHPQSVFLTGLAPAIRQGQAVSVSYADSTGGNDEAAIQDRAGNDAGSFSGQLLANDSTAVSDAEALTVLLSRATDPVPRFQTDLCTLPARTPTNVTVEAVPIVVTSTTDDYFVLFVKHTVDGVDREVAVAVVRGEAGTTTLGENLPALPKERYRVEKYLIASPADIDGDCTDDITELASPSTMNPVNPASQLPLTDGALTIPDPTTFKILAYHKSGREFLKFSIFDLDTDWPLLYFQHSVNHLHHRDFLSVANRAMDAAYGRGELIYYPDLTAPDGSKGFYIFWIADQFFIMQTSADYLTRIYTLLAASMPLLTDNLGFRIPNANLLLLQSELPKLRASRMNLKFDEDIFTAASFEAMNPGDGYGLLRSLDTDDRPGPRDVVIYETLPNELPRVAGIISAAPQTPLSHVNLRAAQGNIPNAYIPDALTDPTIAPLIGGYVHYQVTGDGWQLSAATIGQVLDFFESSRPTGTQTPERDLTVTTIKPLSQIGFDDWNAFGVKAANLAVLRTLGFPTGTVPDGFAIPFYFYDEFMKANHLYEDVRVMLANQDFQTDIDTQEDELKKLRKKIRKASTPQWIIDALTAMHATYPDGQSLRYRSSTNNEDLPGFNGAGLYNSQTQKPSETTEDGIDKSLKQVYASLWNFGAFTERDFYRVDHLSSAMGVLVHPNYKDELVNGVAVSVDPAYGREDSYYFNSQVGEDLVTNPDAHSVPEEFLSHSDGAFTIVALSNLAPAAGQLLMTQAQMDQLTGHLKTIHDKFAELYGVAPGEEFAIEIEYKITSSNIVAIKQARPWVFADDALTPISSPPVSGNALTADFGGATQHSGVPFVVNVLFNTHLTVGFAGFRDHGIVATGGTVTSASRVDSRDDFWKLEVTPDSGGTVRLQLVTNRRCALPGALCAYDGRRLLTPHKLIVPGTVTNTAPTFSSPLFAGGASGLSVPENSFGNTVIGRAPVTDAQNDPLRFTLAASGETTELPFEIHPETGSIRVAVGADLDYEERSTYSVTVTATDDFGASNTATFNIDIEDINESGPVVPPPTGNGGGGGGGGGFAGGGGGGPSGPTPSDVDFEWTVKRDIEGLDSGHDTPSGLWSDGATLWIAENGDGADDAIYAYDLKSGERVEEREFELDARNRAPRGLWSDRTIIWVADSGRNRLFAHNLESGERLPERDLELAERNRDARGIWSDDETMWVLDGGKDALFAYDLATGDPTAEYALDSTNGDPHGLFFDGVTFWVSDHGAKRLFAYRLAAGEDGEAELGRNRDEEFPNTILSRASNNSPRGIWSDGDVMYVADESDDKVYTYNMPDAIDARLATLTLSGVDFGEFEPGATEYEGTAGEGVTQTTVEATTVQRRTDVAFDPPPDADPDTAGHQVALQGVEEITVTVTSADGSRTKTYRVAFKQAVAEIALDAGWNTFTWPGADGVAIADVLRGDGDLANDISATVAALYGWDEEAGAWLAFFPGLGDVPGVNTLATLDQGGAYWIAVTEAVTWTVPALTAVAEVEATARASASREP